MCDIKNSPSGQKIPKQVSDISRQRTIWQDCYAFDLIKTAGQWVLGFGTRCTLAPWDPVVYGSLPATGQVLPTTTGSCAAIRAPTLVVVGDHDIVRPEHTVMMFRLIPNARLAVLPDTDHMATVDRSECVALMIDRFLDSPGPEGRTNGTSRQSCHLFGGRRVVRWLPTPVKSSPPGSKGYRKNNNSQWIVYLA
jgi:hypothetical protein